MIREEMITIAVEDGRRFEGHLARPAAEEALGLVVLSEMFGLNEPMREVARRYAAKGHAVLVPNLFWRSEPPGALAYEGPDREVAWARLKALEVERAARDVATAVAWLRAQAFCTGRVAALGFCMGGRYAFLAAARGGADGAIALYALGLAEHESELAAVNVPVHLHYALEDAHVPRAEIDAVAEAAADRLNVALHLYPAAGHSFFNPVRPTFDAATASLAARRIDALLAAVAAPDLSQLWERHIHHEFVARDVAATMRTMVPEPYVNHIPTMTGGVGYAELARFYEHHFVHGNPADLHITPVSRTVGADRVVDESILSFTHDREIDWMLPGIAPTGRKVEVAVVAVITFEGDKLAHEHIYWDQASVLKQLGLLEGAGLPVAGPEAARKLLDERLPSNRLMARWRTSEGKPIPPR